jgi:hypothetical protein
MRKGRFGGEEEVRSEVINYKANGPQPLAD